MSDKGKDRPFTTSIDQALAARMANCQHSVCTTLPIPKGLALPIYVCTHRKRCGKPCRLGRQGCLLETPWFGPERIEVA